MSGERAHIVWQPLAGWAALVLLIAASALYGSWNGAPGAHLVPIAIAAAQVAIIVFLFMRLARAEGLVRLSAIAGIVWASFLFLLTFADLLTR